MYDEYNEKGAGRKMITSINNNRVKQWKKLHTRKERSRSNTFLIEGDHLVEEALNSGWDIKEIILRDGIESPIEHPHIEPVIVSEEVFQHIAQTETPQGIMAVIHRKDNLTIEGNQVLMVDQVQDPGNLGTMIRTADAAGFSAIIVGEGTVDVFNDKVIRATQGSLFHIPIIQANLRDQIQRLKQDGYTIWATALEKAKTYDQIDVTEKIAVIVGNEGAGIQSNILHEADEIVKIPIYGKAESLNVSIAAAILMYYIQEKLAQ